jgi:hypothetical protein
MWHAAASALVMALLVMHAPGALGADVSGQPISTRKARPWVVRAEWNLACIGLIGGDVSDESSLGVAVGRSLGDAIAIEAGFGYLSDHTQASGSSFFAGPTTSIDLSPGASFSADARWAPLRSPNGAHALTLAAGPSMITGGAFGTVAFVHTEAAYELRLSSPFTFLVGLGPDVALNDSPAKPPSCTGGIFGECYRPFERGDLVWHFRLGLGVSL